MLCQCPPLLPSLSCGDGAGESECPKLQEEIADEFKMNVLWAKERLLGGECAYRSREEVGAIWEIRVVTADTLPGCTVRLLRARYRLAPYLQPAPREGKVPAEMPRRDSSSPAEDPVSHWCRGTCQRSKQGVPARAQSVPGGLQQGSDFKALLLGQRLNQGKAELG